ncbi:hypothetical protein HOD29_04395 [archaeon]|jgi:hypothetical protein|nr:hypothetical protein [archaeon]
MAKIRHLKKDLKTQYSSEETTNIINAIKAQSPSKLEKISRKIIQAIPDEIKGKRYIHFCTYNPHPGIIGSKILEERHCLMGCNHYRRYKEELKF